MKNLNLVILVIILLFLAACQPAEQTTTPVSQPAAATNEPAVEPTEVPATEPAAEPTMVPTAEPEEETSELEAEAGMLDLSALVEHPWQWISFTNPVEQFDVAMPESYLLSFDNDGTVVVTADCNNAAGGYSAEDSSLTIEIGPITMAACPPESRSEQFVTLMSGAARYFFEEGQLFIDLMADGGTMVFIPANPELSANDGEDAVADALWANHWQWVSFTSPVEQVEIDMPLNYQLTFFDDSTLSVFADCNNAFGTFMTDSGALTIEMGQSTLAMCSDDSRSEQFIKLLSNADRYFSQDDNLFIDLIADGGTLEFAPVENPELTDNPWHWTSFTGDSGQYDVEMPESYLLAFSDDGSLTIIADCNMVLGEHTDDGDSLSISPGPATLALCPGDSRGEQFVALLTGAIRYFTANGFLYIVVEEDGGTLEFAPANPELVADDGQGAMAGDFPPELAAELDAWLESQVYTEGGNPGNASPGLVLLVETPEGRYLKAAGVSSLEEGTPMEVDDRLEIGSNTKSFTVVLIMQLQEEGVLSLDDKLIEWLPEQAAIIPNGDEVTLYQLANHVSGIPDYTGPVMRPGMSDPEKLAQGYTPEELVQAAVDNDRTHFLPGEGWSYNNTGYILLGMVAEAATGQPLAELYQERIFDSLGLETAVFLEDSPQEGEVTTQGYFPSPDGGLMNTTAWNASQGGAAGAMAMSAEDLATYGKALANGELFQDRDSLAQMLVFNPDGTASIGAYGLGLFSLGDGYWGHEGTTLAFQSLWFTNPEKGNLAVGLSNSSGYGASNFSNVLNILEGRGAQPLVGFALSPAAETDFEVYVTRWQWNQTTDSSGETAVDAGPMLTLQQNGVAILSNDTCGSAMGTYTAGLSFTLAFDLDTSALTCPEDDPLMELLGYLDMIDSWRFDNGGLVILLTDGTELRFYNPY